MSLFEVTAKFRNIATHSESYKCHFQRSKFWLSVRPGQPKSCRTTKNIDAIVRRVTKIGSQKSLLYIIPCTVNIKLGRTNRNCNSVVRGTTVSFFLIRILVISSFTVYSSATESSKSGFTLTLFIVHIQVIEELFCTLSNKTSLHFFFNKSKILKNHKIGDNVLRSSACANFDTIKYYRQHCDLRFSEMLQNSGGFVSLFFRLR